MSGLQDVRFDVPAQWDPRWFQRFVRDILSKSDIRNAIGTPAVTITGDVTTVATITYGVAGDEQQLANRAFSVPQQALPTIEGQGLNLAAFQRPAVTVPPFDDSQRILAMEIFA